MYLLESLQTCFAKSIVFSGRAGRSEFWWFHLFRVACWFVPVVGWIFYFLTILPALAVTVRRLHDVNRSGFYLLPIFGTPFLALYPLIDIFITTMLPEKLEQGMSDSLAYRYFDYENNFAFFFDFRNYDGVILPQFIWLAFAIYSFIILLWLLKRGDAGGNSYGLPPR